jgi:hypothetical protein
MKSPWQTDDDFWQRATNPGGASEIFPDRSRERQAACNLKDRLNQHSLLRDRGLRIEHNRLPAAAAPSWGLFVLRDAAGRVVNRDIDLQQVARWLHQQDEESKKT